MEGLGIYNNRKSHIIGFSIITSIYIVAAAIGIAVFNFLSNDNILLNILLADLSATLFIWAMGIILKNSSVYDPYWSVAPMVIAPLVAYHLKIWNMGVLLMLAVILLWGIRLTTHWALTFTNLSEQDWRYSQLKRDIPKLWFIVNLFGIHLFPTLVVYLVTIPAYLFLIYFTTLNGGILFGTCLCLFAIIIQTLSDCQMRSFRKVITNAQLVNCEGIWKYIRHPNYLGEILMWWGIYFMLLFTRPSLWFVFIGPVVNMLMFIFISIPLMEKRQLRNKAEYMEYKSRTGMLLPRFF